MTNTTGFRYKLVASLFTFSFFAIIGCTLKHSDAKAVEMKEVAKETEEKAELQTGKMEKASFGMGCFWHSEEMFSEIKGVKEAMPGYSGGKKEDAKYDAVGSGSTGHAETVDLSYNPAVISYQKLLEVFFAEHDPTTPNYSYPDSGPQYRSVIFYRNADQKQAAESYIEKLNASGKFKNKIVTQVVPFESFYRAEDYHIQYYRKHPDQGYIARVTKPEVEKFRKDFPELLK